MLTQPYALWYDWLLTTSFEVAWFKVLPFEDARLVAVDHTFRDPLRWLYHMPPEAVPPGFSHDCASVGGRAVTAEEFMKAPLHQRRVFSKFYDWTGRPRRGLPCVVG
jgi:hypothetical protein